MCRLFGQLSLEPQTALDYLTDSDCSLLAQSNAAKNFRQDDGWGLAWRTSRKFHIFKSPKAAYRQRQIFINHAKKCHSRVVIGHLRAASNPLKLPKKDLIAKRHNQPFGNADLVFAHNGSLNIAAAARDHLLGPYRKELQGNNDSEIYFWILCKWYTRERSVPKALGQTTKDIWNLWRCLPASEQRRWKRPYTGLNAVISDGRSLYALCHSLMPATSTSLCLKNQPYNRLALRFNADDNRLIIGSEKLSRESGWKVLPMHTLTIATAAHGRIYYEVKKFPWKH